MTLLNNMFLVANRANLNVGYAKLGIVSSSNPDTGQMKVILQPDGTETGWMPFPTPWVGNGFGFYAPIEAGTQVVLLFQEGNKDVPIGCSAIYWVQSQPPTGVALGEAVMQHSSGAFIKFSNPGNGASIDINGVPDVSITTTGDLTANVGGDANITAASGSITLTSPTINLAGNVVIDGDLTANNGVITMSAGVITTSDNIVTSADVLASGISLTTHVHGGVTTGGSNTTGPV